MIEIEQGNKIGVIFLEGEHLNRGGVLSLIVSTAFSWIERTFGLKHYDYNSLIFLTLLTFSLLFAGLYYLYRKYPFLYRENKK